MDIMYVFLLMDRQAQEKLILWKEIMFQMKTINKGFL